MCSAIRYMNVFTFLNSLRSNQTSKMLQVTIIQVVSCIPNTIIVLHKVNCHFIWAHMNLPVRPLKVKKTFDGCHEAAKCSVKELVI